MTTLVQAHGASDKEIHELLISLLQKYYSGLIDFAFKNGAILTLILGWLIASDTAQAFFSSTMTIQLISIGMMSLYAIAHGLWVYKWYQKSNIAFSQLQELSYMDSRYYNSQRVQPYQAFLFMFIHGAGSVVTVLFLWHVESPKAKLVEQVTILLPA